MTPHRQRERRALLPAVPFASVKKEKTARRRQYSPQNEVTLDQRLFINISQGLLLCILDI